MPSEAFLQPRIRAGSVQVRGGFRISYLLFRSNVDWWQSILQPWFRDTLTTPHRVRSQYTIRIGHIFSFVCCQGYQSGCRRMGNGTAVQRPITVNRVSSWCTQLRAAVVCDYDDQPWYRRTNQWRRTFVITYATFLLQNVPPPPLDPTNCDERLLLLSELSLTVRRSFNFTS
jgi:hypothetical protein